VAALLTFLVLCGFRHISAENFALGSLRSDDWQLGRPTAPPLLSVFRVFSPPNASSLPCCIDPLGIEKGKPFQPDERQKKILSIAMKKRSRSSAGSRWIIAASCLPIFHPARHGCEFCQLVRVRLQQACGGRIVALSGPINPYASCQGIAFCLVGVERAVKQDHAERW